MKMLLLDGSEISSIEQIHDLFSEKLEFPEWYGRNLDALNDCLSTYSDTVYICVDHPEKLVETLGVRGAALLELFEQVEIDNPNIYCMFSAE